MDSPMFIGFDSDGDSDYASARASPDHSDLVDLDPEQRRSACKNSVLQLFPRICHKYLDELGAEHDWLDHSVIAAILDQQDKGRPYPFQAIDNPLKRKRNRQTDREDEDEERNDEQQDVPESARKIQARLGTAEHLSHASSNEYMSLAKAVLTEEFPRVPMIHIANTLLRDNSKSLYNAYAKFDEDIRNWDEKNIPWKPKVRATKRTGQYTPEKLENVDPAEYSPEQQAVLKELGAARELRAAKDAKLTAKSEEEENFVRAQMEGQVTECGICFEEGALNRMVQCQGEVIHWFCRTCMKSQAETQVGMSKYELTCMSMDGCEAGFSREQRALFLDKKLNTALERIEQETVLRMAGIEDLETCPFCPYAAECPPADEDKEFRCDNPDCQLVSCRLCRKETHIPKTCAEAAADQGLDARHVLEEAMTEALIRRCNKCKHPFVKIEGCNKVSCPQCRTIHCDVCRKTVTDYSHFNDPNRGGKKGQCPLFDKYEQRHQDEVNKAEEDTRKKVAEDNPEVDKDLLHIKVSDRVKEDEQSRNSRDERHGRVIRGYNGRFIGLGDHAVPNPGLIFRALRAEHGPAPLEAFMLGAEAEEAAVREFRQAWFRPPAGRVVIPQPVRLPGEGNAPAGNAQLDELMPGAIDGVVEPGKSTKGSG
ncbi:hypothetical protein F4780DRAFT_577945 [Xylariomycetidae sp. FL0641]|nr:hypothetical protein F4780DRAFT_577945 [Xylariomycetidae sp. FL0641]